MLRRYWPPTSKNASVSWPSEHTRAACISSSNTLPSPVATSCRRRSAAGLAVYVTDIRTLDGAFGSLSRMLAACRLDRPAWLDSAEAAWTAVPEPERRRRAVIPIWRKPWMAVGRDTFTGAVLARLGVDNVLADDPERYPRFDPAALPPHDLVVLPDEPYEFTANDGPEAFPGAPSVLVSGRLLTWYGPSLGPAARELPPLLDS